MILVTAGGGRDGFRLIDEWLNTLEWGQRAAIRGQLPLGMASSLRTHIVCGPMMSTREKNALDERVAPLGCATIERFHKDLNPYIREASVVVSTAGFNTCCQVLSFQKRAVLVPRTGGRSDQVSRAHYLHEQGLIEMIQTDQLDARTLSAKVFEQLCRGARAEDAERYRVVPLDGLEVIAKRVIDSIPAAS